MLERFEDYQNGASVVALGNFDGVHRGHQEILRLCLRAAKSKSLTPVVMTFHPHPAKVLRPDRKLSLLLTQNEKQELLQRAGFQHVIHQTFDKKFSEMSADDFVSIVLRRFLKAREVVIGESFRFGHRAEGDSIRLRNIVGLTTTLATSVRLGDTIVSSSAIRSWVQEGSVQRAEAALGYPYFLDAQVIQGDGRGKSFGVPTANLQTERECLPARGVYTCLVQDEETGLVFAAVTNIGTNPTFSGESLKIETHLISFEGDILNRRVRLFFLERIRNEMKFPSIDELKTQIHRDIESAWKIISGRYSLRSLFSPSRWSLQSADTTLQQIQIFKVIEDLPLNL